MVAVAISSDDAQIDSVNFTAQLSDPATPGSGHAQLYVKGGVLYLKLDDDSVLEVSGAGASLTLKEVDGDPSAEFTTLELPSGTLTDQGAGVARYTPPAAVPAMSIATAFTDAVQNISATGWIDVEGLSVAFTPLQPGKVRCDATVECARTSGTAWEWFQWRFVLDDVTYSESWYNKKDSTSGDRRIYSFHTVFDVTAEAHTVKLQQYRVDGTVALATLTTRRLTLTY